MISQKQILKKLLFAQSDRKRMVASWVALFLGLSLLFIAIGLYFLFPQIINGKNNTDSIASTYITINKEIKGNENTQPVFNDQEILLLKKQSQVQDVGKLKPAGFSAYVSMGGNMGFGTMLPLESVPERFLDVKAVDWNWNEGETRVPIIIPTEFINQYNFAFAPTQGLPQLSPQTIKSIGFTLTIGDGRQRKTFLGSIAGLSDRINSIIVPESFIDYHNQLFFAQPDNPASRIILKVNDPADTELNNYLKKNHYQANKELLKWNRVQEFVSVISLVISMIALVLIFISILSFILFIELTIARAKDAIKLLLEIGYSPRKLYLFLIKKLMPVLLSAGISAFIILLGFRFLIAGYLNDKLFISVSKFEDWKVLLFAASIITMVLWFLKNRISNSVKQFSS